MTTPPNHEAVEAAMKYAKGEWPDQWADLDGAYWHCVTLAAEVERLRADLETAQGENGMDLLTAALRPTKPWKSGSK